MYRPLLSYSAVVVMFSGASIRSANLVDADLRDIDGLRVIDGISLRLSENLSWTVLLKKFRAVSYPDFHHCRHGHSIRWRQPGARHRHYGGYGYHPLPNQL